MTSAAVFHSSPVGIAEAVPAGTADVAAEAVTVAAGAAGADETGGRAATVIAGTEEDAGAGVPVGSLPRQASRRTHEAARNRGRMGIVSIKGAGKARRAFRATAPCV